MAEMTLVTPIRKQSSKHDITIQGRVYNLRLIPCCKEGVAIQYTTKKEMQHPLTGDKIPIDEVLTSVGVHRKWYEPWSLERKVVREIEKLKHRIKTVEAHQNRVNDMFERIG